MFLRVKTTSLEGDKKSLVTYMKLSELKLAIRKHRVEVSRRAEALQQQRYWNLATNISGKPQFVTVDVYHEPVLISVRVCSPKEYHHAKMEERLNNQAAWEEYGERRAGC